MLTPARFTYFQASRDGFEQYRIGLLKFDCVRVCSITEPNRMIGVRLSSIEFWFDFVRLDTSGGTVFHAAPLLLFNYFLWIQ